MKPSEESLNKIVDRGRVVWSRLYRGSRFHTAIILRNVVYRGWGLPDAIFHFENAVAQETAPLQNKIDELKFQNACLKDELKQAKRAARRCA